MLPKKHDGLAMSNLLNMNKAYIMKLGWMLRTGSKGLWCEVIRRKYAKRFTQEDALDSKISDSYLWRSLVKLWPNIKTEEAWIIGNGKSVKAWNDKWINNDLRINDLGINIPQIWQNKRVCDFTNNCGN